MATAKSFEELEVWQLARQLCREVYKVCTSTPLEKDFKLRGQIDAASGSVMDNIAEGFERGGNKEYIQFLSISKGSCGEVRSQLYRVLDRGYIDVTKHRELHDLAEHISKKIENLMAYLKRSDYRGNKYLLKDEMNGSEFEVEQR